MIDTTRQILIGHQGSDHIAITASGRFNTEDWMAAEVSVACDGWRGAFCTSFTRGELGRLAAELQQIQNTLTGEAAFSALEGQLQLQFRSDGKGHVKVSGTAANNLNARLEFTFEIDQTYLASIVAALVAVDPGDHIK